MKQYKKSISLLISLMVVLTMLCLTTVRLSADDDPINMGENVKIMGENSYAIIDNEDQTEEKFEIYEFSSVNYKATISADNITELNLEIPEKEISNNNEIIDLGYHCKAKTYTNWKAVTAKRSNQWNLLHNTQVHICDDGMLRDDDGFICAALGSYFGKTGTRWIFILDNGKEIPIIKCDSKSDKDTDDAHICGVSNYDIIEFYIEPSCFEKEANGYIHWGNFNNVEEFSGAVVAWYQVDTWYESIH